MRSRQWTTKLYDIAESQLGYFTAAQARAAGIHQVRLVQLHQSGDIERVSRGVYRLTRFPVSPLGQYMEAALWPQVRRPDARAVVSHVSALALHELSEVSPAKIHITLPPELRLRRAVPPQLVLHFAPLIPEDVQVVEGVPVTTPARTIRDVHAAHIGPALIRRAIADGRRTGRLTHDEADGLTQELLAEPPSRKRSSRSAGAEAHTAPKKTRSARGKTPAKRGTRHR
ncbi:MAG TPA: type IV toxin-antitoxin system AbiEi family antitoxin domain-containing protein [Gemmatimonadaceae bacterium]|nr:type IV toxin-antitoxin system AbiEi family antitoxin domain-containing protein [Gemmatimonadaceae bacterium]